MRKSLVGVESVATNKVEWWALQAKTERAGRVDKRRDLNKEYPGRRRSE